MRITFKTAMKALALALKEEKRERKNAQNRAYYRRKKQSESVRLPTQNRSESVRIGKDKVFRGITWRDVPGRDEACKKTTFWLISHGDWRGYKSCQYLEGSDLKAAFAKITESQKVKSHKAAQLRTQQAQKPNDQQ